MKRKTKIFVIIFIIGIFVMAGLVYALATFTAAEGGLVGHWVLDEESYNSNTERITDKTPYENHGTNYGATLTTDQMGQDNRALDFDGSSDYVDAGNDDSLDMNTNNFSIATWINTNFEPNQIKILVIENGSSMGGWNTKLISLGYDVTINSSITTKAEVDAYNPDIVACLKTYWGCTKGALLNELYDAGYLLFSEGNDQTNNIRPIETTESTNTQAGTIQADESHPITNGWSTTGGSGTDGRQGITAIHANAYSIANDSSLNYTEAIYLEEPGKGRWYHHQPSVVATDKLIENAVYYLTRHEIVSKGNSYNLFLNNYTLKGFINNETVNTTISSGWNHISLIYDGATQKLYVNNELKESNSFSSSIETNSDNLTIGTIFNGSISDIRIYNRALSADEIDTLYHSYRRKASAGSLQKGLVGHWMLDSEGYNSNTERITDKTPYENHGTNNGTILTTDRMGQGNRAMSFDGEDDYIALDSNVVCDLEHTTISFWMKRDIHNYEGIFHRVIGGGSSFIEIDKQSNKFYLEPTDNNYYNAYLDTGIDTSDNVFHHYTFVFTKKNNLNNIDLYVDGSLADTFNGGTWSPTMIFKYIGAEGSQVTYIYGEYFDGTISGVRVYNRALSADEIDTLYHSYRPEAASGSLQKGLVLDMPLDSEYTKDETVGSEILTDRTPYSNDGQNYGATVGSDYTSFDGNDYVDVSETVPLNFTTSFSYGAWFKADGFGDWNGIISREPTWGNGYNLQAGTVQKIACGWGTYTNSNDAPVVDRWYHAVCMYNGTAMRLYVDGVLQNDIDIRTMNAGTGNLMIGVFYTVPSLFFNGSISNVRIYNRALSESEIKLLYDKGR